MLLESLTTQRPPSPSQTKVGVALKETNRLPALGSKSRIDSGMYILGSICAQCVKKSITVFKLVNACLLTEDF